MASLNIATVIRILKLIESLQATAIRFPGIFSSWYEFSLKDHVFFMSLFPLLKVPLLL